MRPYIKKRTYKSVSNYKRKKMAFKRPCKRCERIYNPTGKFSKFCEDCKIKCVPPKSKKRGKSS